MAFSLFSVTEKQVTLTLGSNRDAEVTNLFDSKYSNRLSMELNNDRLTLLILSSFGLNERTLTLMLVMIWTEQR